MRNAAQEDSAIRIIIIQPEAVVMVVTCVQALFVLTAAVNVWAATLFLVVR